VSKEKNIKVLLDCILNQSTTIFVIRKTLYGDSCTSKCCLYHQQHEELGNLTNIDGSLIDAVLSMYWAAFRKGSKKAKVHFGFDLNCGIPRKIFLTK